MSIYKQISDIPNYKSSKKIEAVNHKITTLDVITVYSIYNNTIPYSKYSIIIYIFIYLGNRIECIINIYKLK